MKTRPSYFPPGTRLVHPKHGLRVLTGRARVRTNKHGKQVGVDFEAVSPEGKYSWLKDIWMMHSKGGAWRLYDAVAPDNEEAIAVADISPAKSNKKCPMCSGSGWEGINRFYCDRTGCQNHD